MSLHKITAVVFALQLLSGCGFHSLYGSGAVERVEDELAKISIRPIADRVGQRMRNELLDLLTPKGRPLKPTYALAIQLRVTEQNLGVEATALSTRANLRMQAAFSLSALENSANKGSGGAAVLFSGDRLAVAGYNIYTSDFATLKAKEDAETRAIRQIGREIQTQLAVYFAQARDQGMVKDGRRETGRRTR